MSRELEARGSWMTAAMQCDDAAHQDLRPHRRDDVRSGCHLKASTIRMDVVPCSCEGRPAPADPQSGPQAALGDMVFHDVREGMCLAGPEHANGQASLSSQPYHTQKGRGHHDPPQTATSSAERVVVCLHPPRTARRSSSHRHANEQRYIQILE